MKRYIRPLIAGTLGAALLVGLPTSASAGSKTTTCTDVLAPGSYHRVVVPEGASCLSDGPVTIRGGLFIEPGATFVLGSEENPVDTGTISGGVHATNPASVQIHFTTINGGVDVHGGSGPFGGPFDITWNAIEDNRINGGATVEGYDGFWFGFIRNRVNGTVSSAVSMMIGTTLRRLRSSRATSWPARPGPSATSSRMMSNGAATVASSAACPSPTAVTVWPSRVNDRASMSRSGASSSTTRMRRAAAAGVLTGRRGR